MSNDEIYAKVTAKFVEALNAGRSPWATTKISSGSPKNLLTGKEYTGINRLILSIHPMTSLYSTFKQAMQLKAPVKKGESGIPLLKFNVAYKHTNGKIISEEMFGKLTHGEQLDCQKLTFVNYFTVFSVDQLTENETMLAKKNLSRKPDISFEALLSGYFTVENLSISHHGSIVAFNNRTGISMPHLWQFERPEDYYLLLANEAVMATGEDVRLNWRTSVTQEFAKLVGGIGAAFLADMAGTPTNRIMADATDYFPVWSENISKDPKYLIRAARIAQKAVDFIADRIDLMSLVNATLQQEETELV